MSNCAFKTKQTLNKLKQQVSKLESLAFRDPLTGLNRISEFKRRLNNALDLAARDEQKVVLIYLDFDKFKSINDTLGHSAGDNFLKRFTERLTDRIPTYKVGRRTEGADEFVIYHEAENEAEIAEVVEKVEGLSGRPIYVEDKELTIDFSLGSSIFPDEASEAEGLLEKAEEEMFMDKNNSRALKSVADNISQKGMISYAECN